MRIGVDALGGDFAPEEPVKGVLAARGLLGPDDRIVLIGDEPVLRQRLAREAGWEDFIELNHAPDVVGMDEAPVEALRKKPNSSIVRMAELAAGKAVDAIVSAGNTGACVAACQMRLRRLAGAQRPGIAIVIPTYDGPVVMCDVGANVKCRPMHLYQYGIMASEYSQRICGIEKPRVGLLSIGEEDAKGNQLVKETRAIMKEDPSLHFMGNVEGRDIFRGVCDVVITDGFVGNVCLKLMEGLAEGLFKTLAKEFASNQGAMVGLVDMRNRFDFNRYGGAPLLGVNGHCIICHGASQALGLTNAVRVAMDFVKTRINDHIVERFARSQGPAA